MRIDPRENFVIQEAMRKWGEITVTRAGDTIPWKSWHNVRPIVIAAFRLHRGTLLVWPFHVARGCYANGSTFSPIGRFNWFFRICQFFVRLGERFVVTVIESNQEIPRREYA
jgi:hypothetical protein